MARTIKNTQYAGKEKLENINNSIRIDDAYKEPKSIQIDDEWDTNMEEYFDEIEDFQDIDFPRLDNDY